MHHALQIQEILLNIFSHCRRSSVTSDLPTVARTRRAFKEPALDVPWEELVDPSPKLARCLAGASHRTQISPRADKVRWFQVFISPCLTVNILSRCSRNRYFFGKALTQIEWSIVRSYTRHIRSLLDDRNTLDWESVSTFLNLPTTEPLFPNLHHLHAVQLTEIKIKHLLHLPFPSLISLDLSLIDGKVLYPLQGSLESFSKFSPNIRKLRVLLSHPDITFSKFFSNHICRWQKLQTVCCLNITLDVDALAHLSRMPALTQLHCMPSATLPPAGSPLVFSNLHYLALSSEFLDPIAQLFSRTQLPTITDVTACMESRPSKRGFSFFLAGVQASAIGHTIEELQFEERLGTEDGGNATYILGFEDLQPCTALSNLRRIHLDFGWEVDLSDSELLTLASAWPRLEHLSINLDHSWNAPGRVTPNGLVQLLQTCRSLSELSHAIDTRS